MLKMTPMNNKMLLLWASPGSFNEPRMLELDTDDYVGDEIKPDGTYPFIQLEGGLSYLCVLQFSTMCFQWAHVRLCRSYIGLQEPGRPGLKAAEHVLRRCCQGCGSATSRSHLDSHTGRQ